MLSVALTPVGDWVLSGSKDRGVQFWDPHTGVAQLMLQGHKNSVISVAPSPTGGLFATGSGDMRARIWRLVPFNPEVSAYKSRVSAYNPRVSGFQYHTVGGGTGYVLDPHLTPPPRDPSPALHERESKS